MYNEDPADSIESENESESEGENEKFLVPFNLAIAKLKNILSEPEEFYAPSLEKAEELKQTLLPHYTFLQVCLLLTIPM